MSMAIDRNDPEVLALIEEVTAPLAAKTKELLGELRSAKAKAKGSDIDPEDYARLQSEVEELSGRLAQSDKLSKGEIAKLTKSLQEKDGALNGLLVDSGISDALAKAGVAPHYVNPLKAMFKTQAQLVNENGAYKAVIGDKGVADAIGAYLSGDEGKHFVAAPANSGGGAQGSGGKGASGASGKRSEMSITDKAAFIAEHGQDAYLNLPA
jgi:hypothetical protein